MNIEKDIKKGLSKICKIPIDEIEPQTNIYESKIISSLQMLDLMKYLEEKFDIIVLPEELIYDNFEDIKSLSEYVSKKINI